MADTQQKSAELAARLDRLPFSKWHRKFFTVCFLGVMFDACDFALFGMALPPVAREFGLNPAQAGLLATVGLIGAFVGALFEGMEIIGSHPFRVTRNSDLFLDEEEIKDLRAALQGELPQRHYGDSVRLEIAAGCPPELEQFLLLL